MGFDIYAYPTDKDEDYDDMTEIAYHRAYMGGFRMLREQGYDWFNLLGAEGCDGGVSGTGEQKVIPLKRLRNALAVLLKHKPTGLARGSPISTDDMRDEFSHRKPLLAEFMRKCIAWCEDNEKEGILIYFG